MSRILETIQIIRRQRDFPGLLATIMFLGLSGAFTGPYLTLWGRHLGLSSAQFSGFFAIVTIAGIFLSLGISRWSDGAVPRRTVLILGAGGGILGNLGYAFVTNVVALTIIGSLAFGVSTVCFAQLFAHVREDLDQSENARGRTPLLMSVLRMFFGISWMIGPGLGAFVLDAVDYRGLFCSASGLLGCFLIGVLLFVPARPHPVQPKTAESMSVWHAIFRARIAIYFWGLSLFFAAHTLGTMTTPLIITGELGAPETAVGIVSGWGPAFEMPLMLWFGQLASRGHTLRLIRIGVALNIAYFLLMMVAREPWHMWPMQAFAAAAIAINANITIGFFQDLLPGQPGLATTLFGNTFCVGQLAGVIAFSVRDQVGNYGILWICVGLTAVALLLVLLQFRQGQRERDAARAEDEAAAGMAQPNASGGGA